MNKTFLSAIFLLSCGASKTEDPLCYPEPTKIDFRNYTKLSDTGLLSNGSISCGIEQYEPNFHLYSDTAEKKRFFSLPINQQIDTSDPDHWAFPIGTRFWKEFTVDGKKVETRLIERTDSTQYFMGAFVWNEEQTEAFLSFNGEENALDTIHDVPSFAECRVCHEGEPGRILGFSAVQLSGERKDKGPNLSSLMAENLLSFPSSDYDVPGNDTEKELLSYFHANCGHCHNEKGSCADSGLVFRLSVLDHDAETSPAFKTTINVPALYSADGNVVVPATVRVIPGDPLNSALIQRMTAPRSYRMPYIGVKIIDEPQVKRISEWIENLPH